MTSDRMTNRDDREFDQAIADGRVNNAGWLRQFLREAWQARGTLEAERVKALVEAAVKVEATGPLSSDHDFGVLAEALQPYTQGDKQAEAPAS